MTHILLVEDNPDNATMMIRLLESEHYKVTHEAMGLKGAKVAREVTFDLILMDFNLPDIDGRTLTLILKKQLGAAAPPIIAVTARTGEREKLVAHQFGCDAFISKPFEPDEFLDTVAKFVPNRVESESDDI